MAGGKSGGTFILNIEIFHQSLALPSAFGYLLPLSPRPLKVLQGKCFQTFLEKNYSLKLFSFSLKGPIEEIVL